MTTTAMNKAVAVQARSVEGDPAAVEAQHQRLLEALAACHEATERAKIELTGLRRICPHSDLIEVDYIPYPDGHAIPPRRSCLTCGIEEEGWGAGYRVLRSESVRRVTREEFYASRKPILRSEVDRCYGCGYVFYEGDLVEPSRCSECNSLGK